MSMMDESRDDESGAQEGSASQENLSGYTLPEPEDDLYWKKRSRFWRSLIFFGGVIAPIVCFFAAAFSQERLGGGELWQNDSLSTYNSLLTAWPAIVPFYPLLIYSIVSLSLVLWDRDRFTKVRVVRFGLYTGILVSVQYFFLVFTPSMRLGEIVVMPLAMLAVTTVGTTVLVLLAMGLFALGWKRFLWGSLALSLLLGLLALITTVHSHYEPESFAEDSAQMATGALIAPFMFVYMICLVFGNVWCVAIYSSFSWIVWKESGSSNRQFSLKALFGLMSWAAVYFAAWRISINLMLVEYTKLPTEDPNCYVCTAAARGHRRVVGSETICRENGHSFQANDQMRWLKAAELVLFHTMPRFHRVVRTVYNRLGPRLASRISHPIVADLVYWSLLPASWVAGVVLSRILIHRGTIVHRLYRT